MIILSVYEDRILTFFELLYSIDQEYKTQNDVIYLTKNEFKKTVFIKK